MTGALSVGAPIAAAPTHPDRPGVTQRLGVVLDEPIDGGRSTCSRARPRSTSSSVPRAPAPSGWAAMTRWHQDGGALQRDDGEFVVLRLELPKGTRPVAW